MRGSAFRKAAICALALVLALGCAPAAFAIDEGESVPDNSSVAVPVDDPSSEASEGVDSGSLVQPTDEVSELAPDADDADGVDEPLSIDEVAGQLNDVADGIGSFVESFDAPTSERIAAGTYMLISAADPSFALSVPGFTLADDAQLVVSAQTGSLAQLVVVSVDDEGYASLRLANSGHAIGVGSSALLGAPVAQQDRTGAATQQWSFQRNADGSWTILSRLVSLALTCSPVEGGAVSLAADSGLSTQRWMLHKVATPLSDGVYSFYSLLDNSKAIDTADASPNPGARAQLYSRNGTPAQKLLVTWQTSENGVSGVTIQSLSGGCYLTGHENGSTSFEARVEGESQLWSPSANASGGISFTNAQSGLALFVAGGVAVNGASLALAQPDGSAAQSFRTIEVVPLEDGTYTITLASTGRALDVANASRESGANVQVVAPNGGGAQVWNVTSVGDGYYTIVNARSKKALDVEGGVWAAGTNVHQWTQNGGGAQLWRIDVTPEGCYSFATACGGYLLEAAGGGTWDGANVFVGEPLYSTAQQFRVAQTTYVPENYEDLLGTFTTYSTNTYNGTYNMQRALQSFNGVVVEPGQTLSFFATAGPCGAAQGYLPAGVVGGTGYGGGICQASTTLYGAAIRAGMTITDRQNHSVPSTYVPIGLDAMVNYGTSDFQFRNDLEYPVRITVYTYDNVLTCEIWGIQPEWYDYIEPSSWYTGYNTAAAQRTYYKDGVAVYTEALPSSWYW